MCRWRERRPNGSGTESRASRSRIHPAPRIARAFMPVRGCGRATPLAERPAQLLRSQRGARAIRSDRAGLARHPSAPLISEPTRATAARPPQLLRDLPGRRAAGSTGGERKFWILRRNFRRRAGDFGRSAAATDAEARSRERAGKLSPQAEISSAGAPFVRRSGLRDGFFDRSGGSEGLGPAAAVSRQRETGRRLGRSAPPHGHECPCDATRRINPALRGTISGLERHPRP